MTKMKLVATVEAQGATLAYVVSANVGTKISVEVNMTFSCISSAPDVSGIRHEVSRRKRIFSKRCRPMSGYSCRQKSKVTKMKRILAAGILPGMALRTGTE